MTNISRKFLTVLTLTRLYDVFSDDVRAIWINRDLFKLSKKIAEQRKIICTLKIAKTKLMKSAMKSFDDRNNHDFTKAKMSDASYIDLQSIASLWKRYLNEKNRDHMRSFFFDLIWMSLISFVEKKINTIYYCWQKMTRLNNKIDQNQQKSEKYSLLISVFIQFYTQKITYITCQFLIQCAFLSS